MEITKRLFGQLKEFDIYEYTIKNSNDYSLSVITYGGIITKILMPDKNGNLENITVNFKHLEEMVQSRPMHGTIVGPVSGRISNAAYQDGNLKILLEKNENSHNLHSGSSGLDQHIWLASMEKDEDKASLILKTLSPDGEFGFPGDLKVAVTYTLNEENQITIDYKAETNKRTLFNPTNHVYFNLNGSADSLIYNHQIQINSHQFSVLDDENIPTGELRAVEGTDFDLRRPKRLKDVLASDDPQIKNRAGYDHPFVLNKTKESPALVLKEKSSGRVLEMSTDAEAVVIYTHNTEKVPMTNTEQIIPSHAGITIETCSLPDAVNQKDFPFRWLEPGEKFESITTFSFRVEI